MQEEINSISRFSSMGSKDNRRKNLREETAKERSSQRSHDLVPHQDPSEVLKFEAHSNIS